jgi:ribose 1,5-bisphosphokinase
MNGSRESKGALVLVVGPSGAGKDTLINYLRERLHGRPGFAIVRRVVTRPASAADEDHDTLPADLFERRSAEGAFAFTWRAHDLHYGLPIALNDWLSQGRVVVANVSRSIIGDACRRYPGTVVINVTAPQPILARRIAGRGRETESAIDERLSRSTAYDLSGDDVVTIDNSREVEVAGEELVSIVTTLLDRICPGSGPADGSNGSRAAASSTGGME